MKRINMTLSYQIGDETNVLNKALELYEQWDTKCGRSSNADDEFTITIHPGLM